MKLPHAPSLPGFTPGTRLMTEHGERRVETLCPGDLLMTRDAGLQPLLATVTRTLAADRDNAPIAVTNALFSNAKRTLLVSPTQSLLVENWRAEMLFGQRQVLVQARHMIDGDRAFDLPRSGVMYVHLILPAHHLLVSEGVPVESLLMADTTPAILSIGCEPSLGENIHHLASKHAAHRPVRRHLTQAEASALISANGDTFPRRPRRKMAPVTKLTLI
ncbi:Hint domain-containing protein [Shimia abyssi]|uniref:Hint domain-containing protein n=1 Tax=Shimia abyssi TaxID=1662395 RepID=A0A2P8FJL9_9RHOB|nr:Hint domain-containing protein [Shimia abyssi]PSL21898.1 Hint domain-containing protein [Shimia abyssi]